MRYDWRERFGSSFDDVGGRPGEWGEALDLVALLAADPTSRFCASLNEWDYPFSREAMLLADVFDLTAHIATPAKKRGRLKPHPLRPWKLERTQRFGKTDGRSREEIAAILAAAAAGDL